MNKALKACINIIALLIVTGIILLAFIYRDRFSISFILSAVPDNLFYAGIILMILYTLKGISLFFPILILQIAGGLIFPPVSAFILNCVGTALAYTLPYIIGRISGRSLVDKIALRYKKFDEFVKTQKDSKSFASFILRAVSCLPADLVSLYLGSVETPYAPYVIWSVIGTLPGLIPATFMGLEMTDPTSPAFIISVVATILSSAISCLIYYIIKKRRTNILIK